MKYDEKIYVLLLEKVKFSTCIEYKPVFLIRFQKSPIELFNLI